MGSNKILIVQFLRKELIQEANYNFGMAPNRLLIKALKKAVNFESADLK
jgi:hypothetical protein